MKYLAAFALLFVLCGTAAAQTTFGWSEYYAQQRNFELQQIRNELSEMNHQRALRRIRYRGRYRPSYNYRSSYRYNTWRPTYGGWGWTNGGF